jgi:hypothetical protein
MGTTLTKQMIHAYIDILSDLGNEIWNAGLPVDVVTIAMCFTTAEQFERHIGSCHRMLERATKNAP